ncbi:hypothetical protein H310_02398 [Aphanomyces invadans]|uniref:Methyltransferase-like protein 4 n=1 Tax=Aphanomyces invadans TaxID=157072 RepID=A0A024UQB5_9STRA|nr:hypothetical protein H310_02398 [Aphanomyces invadans]ETW08022.1 hypothetical protein H310_02398 [Aphanomyces invadans]|eukprot:XP_008864115.1 hypothetical protein H310_02398 [Aphanomyces invadans]
MAVPSETFLAINHLDIVNDYYNGFQVSASSLRIPHTAYIKASTNPKKRKRSPSAAPMRLPPAELLVTLEAARQYVLPHVHDLLPQYIKTVPDSPARDATPTARSDQTISATLMDGLQENNSDDDVLVMHDKRQYLLPRHCTFVLGDIFRLPRFPTTFRCIVMDPPWENRTVARGATYATMPHVRLLNLDVPSLACPDGALLVIWVTNKPAFHDFIVDELLPRWGFTFLQTWHWVKVAADGECVTPLSSTHKLPFEKALVAGRGAFADMAVAPRVAVSVPLRHSWKPPLAPLLTELGIDEEKDNKVEIFARELRPHWTCIGNEVLKFQDLCLFDAKPPDTSVAGFRAS